MKFYSFIPDGEIVDELQAINSEREAWLNRKPFHEIRERMGNLPSLNADDCDFSTSIIRIGADLPIEHPDRNSLDLTLKAIIPWKKGPYRLFGIDVDAEWRSDFKWDRFCESLPSQKDKMILDVGCNNGYYMFRLLPQKPCYILGIDPVPRLWYQFNLLQNYARIPEMEFAMWGWEQLSLWHGIFDTILCMGILYHHRNPLGILENLRNALKPGGLLVMESIVLPGEGNSCLFPPDRYARMRNVWFLPTVTTLCHMLERCKFIEIERISVVDHKPEEQRTTPWNPGPSYAEFLDPEDPEKTIEGHPAPKRAIIFARKKDHQ